MTPIELDRAAARRFLAARHLLAPPRSLPAGPASVMAVVERLGSLQFDPLEVAGRNHDLVLAARIAGYRRETIDALLYGSRELYETYNKGLSIVPTRELPLYRITWDQNRAEHDGGTFDEHAPLVEELLDRIRRDGPLAATDVEPRAAIDWYWRPTNQVRAILEALAEAGILALARRDGNRRVYDLTERLFPGDLLAERPPVHEQRRHKLLSRFRAHGLLGRSGSAELWIGTVTAKRTADDADRPTRGELIDELVEDGALHPVTVESLRGPRYVVDADRPLLETVSSGRPVPGGLGAEPAVPGVAFLAPLDPLVWDRELLRRLYDFDYVWEVYVPETKRRWGYYVLPLLYGDRLVGRIEPRIDRRAGVLRVLDVWWETGFDPLDTSGFVDALTDALDAHARFAGVTRIRLPRAARHRGLAAALRARLGPRGRVRA